MNNKIKYKDLLLTVESLIELNKEFSKTGKPILLKQYLELQNKVLELVRDELSKLEGKWAEHEER